jgi:hypothetical protein
MKSPFRYQTTEYDCVPTTFTNAIQFLFDREKIPPEIVQKIMQYSLDTVNRHGETGKRGTTAIAVQMILQWLTESSKPNKFSVTYEYHRGENVHLRQNNRIVSCLNRRGVALMSVCYDDKPSIYHYMLALQADEDYIYFFDPLYRKRGFIDKELIWLGKNREEGQTPNIKVTRQRLDLPYAVKYSFGTITERECCLLERIAP